MINITNADVERLRAVPVSSGSQRCRKLKQANCSRRLLNETLTSDTSVICSGQSPLCSVLSPSLEEQCGKSRIGPEESCFGPSHPIILMPFLLCSCIPLFLFIVMFCLLNFVCWIPFGI